MAASITIGSLALAADGKTITGTLSGGTGTGYGPATGVTKIIVKSGGFAYAYPAATATLSSGGALSVTLGFAIPAGVVTVDVLTTSNITDSGANTAQGQTGVSVTNNSTAAAATTFTGSDANLALNGQLSPGTLSARSCKTFAGTGSQVDFKLAGTDLALLMNLGNAFADQALVSFNGGAYVALTGFDTTFGWTVVGVPAFSGQAQASYDVSVRGGASGSLCGLDSTLAIWARGSSTPTLAKHANWGVLPLLDGTEAKVINNGSTALSGSLQGYSNATDIKWEDGAIRFRATTSAIKIWGFRAQGDYVLSVDGVDNGTVFQEASTNTFGLSTYWTGLDDTAVHEYTIKGVWQFSLGSNHWRHLNFPIGPNTPTGGFLDSASPGAFPADSLVTIGDSITEAVQGTPANSQIGYTYKIATKLGLRPMNRGRNGTTEHNFVGSGTAAYTTLSGEARVHADLTTNAGVTSGTPRCFIDLYGTNDIGNTPPLGTTPAGASAETASSHQTSLVNVWTDVLTAFPTARVLICSILERSQANNTADATYGISSGNNTERLAFNTARSNAVTALQASFPSATIRYVNLDGVIAITAGNFPTASADTFDGLHANDTGHTKVANRIGPFAATAAFSGGAASGAAGVATPAFTYTLAAGTFGGTDTVTLAASNGTITATAASGSISGNGTGTVIVTPAANATNFTFTYTPAASGVKTITPTNGQGWTDPAAASVTAIAGGGRPVFGLGLAAGSMSLDI